LKYEKKFVILSFLIIFSLLLALIVIINQNSYKEYKGFLKENIKKDLEICSYRLKCKNAQVNFVKKDKSLKTFTLLENNSTLYMLFDIPKIKNYYLELSISKKEYLKELEKIKKRVFYEFLIDLVIITFISAVFAYILLIPLKQAYRVNETFIKDILHDFNTPITTLKLSLYMLKKGYNPQTVKNIENSINSILSYQKKLKDYLTNNPIQSETFELKDLIDEIAKQYTATYKDITFKNSASCKITGNKSAFYSVLENIISNAFKYNVKNGSIEVFMKDKKLHIKDTGIGIKNTKRVFERFYKENDRGIGIGLSIVEKLAKSLNIKIEVKSAPSKGSEFILDLKKYC